MSEPERSGREQDEAPGCAQFEQTMELLDGLLSGAARDAAQGHARACGVCGPLLEGWPALQKDLVAGLEGAAEKAKPDLARMADRVLAQVEGPAKAAAPQKPAGLAWLAGLLQPWVALAAAAAALVLVLLPLLRPTASTGDAGLVAGAEAPIDDGIAQANDCLIHKVTFDGADGMVYRTEQGGMTVIWVSEHDDV
jgi:hypothetical protein